MFWFAIRRECNGRKYDAALCAERSISSLCIADVSRTGHCLGNECPRPHQRRARRRAVAFGPGRADTEKETTVQK